MKKLRSPLFWLLLIPLQLLLGYLFTRLGVYLDRRIFTLLGLAGDVPPVFRMSFTLLALMFTVMIVFYVVFKVCAGFIDLLHEKRNNGAGA